MNIEDFLREVENSIDGVKANSLTPETDFKNDISQWDSLAALSVISMIDSKYGVIISGIELDECKTLENLFDEIVSKK